MKRCIFDIPIVGECRYVVPLVYSAVYIRDVDLAKA